MLKRLFCNHKYTFMFNPKHQELRGIWMNDNGKVWNKVICEKCGRIKRIYIIDSQSKKTKKQLK